MSFVVLGVSAQRLDDIVARRVAAMERRLKRPPQPGSTDQRVKKVLSKIREQPPREVVSSEYSAPQFCRDFIDLAAKQGYQFLTIARRGIRGQGERPWEIYE